MKAAEANKDRHQAFLLLRDHFLGRNNMDHLSTQAETKLTTLSYTGEGRRWNFEKYIKAHVDQHIILDGLRPFGYAGIDTRSKIRHMMNGIKTNSLEVVKTQILADTNLRGDFNACVNLFTDFIKQKDVASGNKTDREATISAVKVGNEKSGGEADMSVEDRYYTRQEYMRLSNAKKNGLRLKREARVQDDGQPSKKKPRKNKKGDGKPAPASTMNLSKRQIAALAKQVRFQLDGGAEDGSASDASAAEDTKAAASIKKGNLVHKALTRGGKM